MARKCLDKLLKSGEITEQMRADAVDVLGQRPGSTTLCDRPKQSDTPNELFPFGRTYDEVLRNRGTAEDWQLLGNLVAIMMQKNNQTGFSSLSQSERYVYVMDGMLTEVNNGGFYQFFFNSTGELAYDLVPALAVVGSIEFLSIAEKAMALFGEVASLDEESRYAHLDAITKSDELPLWEACDEAFFDCKEPLEAMIIDYAERHLTRP